jgi:multimeric flavodoxin WrbA
MNIGIMVYSHTGHTLSVARQLEQKLSADGHAVTLVKLEISGPVNAGAERASLRTVPTIAPYDGLVFASPVNGGRMSAAMATYLEQTPPLRGRKVAFLLTHFFIRRWGTEQTIAQMTEVCEAKGASILGASDVRWSSLRRGREIARAVDSLSDLF